jgi:DNA-directed RNA polymerase subunit beta
MWGDSHKEQRKLFPNIGIREVVKSSQEYKLETFHRSNQDTCLTHKPVVTEGDWVQSGDLLTDCSNSVGGDLSLGQNIFLAYMPWEGYNFEDAILISERLVTDDVFTSVHIERYEIDNLQKNELRAREDRAGDTRAYPPSRVPKGGAASPDPSASFAEGLNTAPRVSSKHGVSGSQDPVLKKTQKRSRGLRGFTQPHYEEITRNIPDISEQEVSNLDEFGIIKIGSWVEEGDILVGKISPINKKEFTPYQKLLYTILDKQMRPYRDSSLRAPKGIKAKVIDIKIFVKPRSPRDFQSRGAPPRPFGAPDIFGVAKPSEPDPPCFEETRGRISKKRGVHETWAQNPRPRDLRSHGRSPEISSGNTNVRREQGFKSIKETPTHGLNRGRLRWLPKLREKLRGRVARAIFSRAVGQKTNLYDLSNTTKNFLGFPFTPRFEETRGSKTFKKYPFLQSAKAEFTINTNVRSPIARAAQRIYTRSLRNTYDVCFSRGDTLLPRVSSKRGDEASSLFETWVSKQDGITNLTLQGKKESRILRIKDSKKSQKMKKILSNEFLLRSKTNKKLRVPSKRGLRGLKSIKDIETIHIYLAEKRKIQVGDKMSGRHGNKGIISQILPVQDMPFLPDGTPIDMVLNPLGVPSRMNVGQIYECLLGLAGKYLGEYYRITSFDEIYGSEASRTFVFNKLYEARCKTGFKWLFNPKFPGKIRIFDGRTGECFHQPVTVGQTYMLRLVHMVDDKIHMRSTGPYSLITQQPLRGRSKQGGQRLGEMEVWALEGYGAAFTLLEMLTIKSDDLTGRMTLWSNLILNKDITIGTPEAFKVLICELQALCLDIGLFRHNPNHSTINSYTSEDVQNSHFFNQEKISAAPRSPRNVLSRDLIEPDPPRFFETRGLQSHSSDFNQEGSISRKKKSLTEITSLMSFP